MTSSPCMAIKQIESRLQMSQVEDIGIMSKQMDHILKGTFHKMIFVKSTLSLIMASLSGMILQSFLTIHNQTQ